MPGFFYVESQAQADPERLSSFIISKDFAATLKCRRHR